jgi:hypothetical protein
MKIDRAEFRRAIADEVATLRAVNTALRGPLTPEDAATFANARAYALHELRHLFTALYQRTPHKPVQRAPRAAQRTSEAK